MTAKERIDALVGLAMLGLVVFELWEMTDDGRKAELRARLVSLKRRLLGPWAGELERSRIFERERHRVIWDAMQTVEEAAGDV